MDNWLRTYTLKCGVEGQVGFELGNILPERNTVLHMAFSIDKTDTESSNTAKVTLWNLSDESLRVLESKDCKVELKAGYGRTMFPLLTGTITSVETEKDGADNKTTIEVVDGKKELRDSYISVSYNGAINTRNLYDYIAKQMGMAVMYGETVKFTTIPNGFTYVGKAADALTKIADVNGHKWTIQNHILQVTNPGEALSNYGYLISFETGLITTPKKVKKTTKKSGKSSTEEIGYDISFLLNGAIGINDIILLQSKTATGTFRVKKLSMDGDNMTADWKCSAQVVQIGG